MEKKCTNQTQKIAVTPEAETILLEALKRVNDDFLGGKVTKLDLASWAIQHVLENMPDAIIEKIRKRFFNEVCYLETVLKQTRASGQDRLSVEQVSALQDMLSPKHEKTRKLKDINSTVLAD